MEKIKGRKRRKRRLMAFAICFLVAFNTLLTPVNTYASGYVVDRMELSNELEYENDEKGFEETQETASATDAVMECDDDELGISDEELSMEAAVSGGRELSSHIFYSKHSSLKSWRDNWFTRSMANYDRLNGYEYDTEATFKKICVNSLSDKSVDCSGYVSKVLMANGEMASGDRQVTATFESWLTSNGYYNVLGGDYKQLVQGNGSTTNKSYTSDAESILANVQSGDILLWAYENSDGSFTPKHISIGYVYDGDALGGAMNSMDTFYKGEVCVFQSNGVFTNGAATVNIESVAYYLSGANSGTSYGSALKIFRKKPVAGNLQVSKKTDTGEYQGGVVFGLYKVSYDGYSLLNKDTTALNMAALDLSGLNDSNISASYEGKSGLITKVATFTTNDSGVGVPKLTTGIQNAHTSAVNNSNYGGDWYQIAVDTAANKITGLPIGDYIIIEEKETIAKEYWKKGGTYGGVTLDDNTVNCQISVTAGGNTILKNGMQSGTVNSLCDFGFGQGSQYYSMFTIANTKSKDLRTVTSTYKNFLDDSYEVQIYKAGDNSSEKSSMAGATYGLYSSSADAKKASNRLGVFTIGGTYEKTETVTTAADGSVTKGSVSGYSSNVLTVSKSGTYYVKELTGPQNGAYLVDENVYSVVVNGRTNVSGNITLGQVYETPKPRLRVIKSSDSVYAPSMEGIIYGVYAAESDARSRNGNYVAKFSLSADGSSAYQTLPAYGTYYTIELSSNDSYYLSDEIYTTTFAANHKVEGYEADFAEMCKEVLVSDAPRFALSLKKASANSKLTDGNNCYNLSGAVYAVYNNKNGKGYLAAAQATEKNYTSLEGYTGELITDENGDTGRLDNMTEGVYYVREVKAPKGYALDCTVYKVDFSDTSKLTDNTYILSVTDKPQTNPVDILLVKEDSSDKSPVEGAEFTIRFYAGEYGDNVNPETQGISPVKTWIVRTDENGKATADEEHRVGGDEWYTNPETGAVELPLGTITIQETKAPKGYAVNTEVFVRKISSEGDESSVSTYNAPTVEEAPTPTIHTSAGDLNTGTGVSLPDSDTVIYDDVHMTNLVKGKTYTIKGTLMDAETGRELTVDGKNITAETSFTAEASDVTIRMEFSLDASALAGKTTVVFESLYVGDKRVAVHDDLADEGQTVHFPWVSTTAKEKSSGTHETMSSEKYELVDTVRYTNLLPGMEYVVRGVLMNAGTGEPVIYNGEAVTGYKRFTAASADGNVDVEFSFGGSEYADLTTVVYEELFIVISDDEGKECEKQVAFHRDINDAGQSIYIDYTRAAFAKVDADTKEMLAGAGLSLYDSDGELVEEWISDGSEHIINNLLPGTYTLAETSAPKGYRLAASIDFVIDGTTELQTITMENEVLKGSVHITKVDNVDNGKKLAGVSFMLFKEADSIMDTLIDRDYAAAWDEIQKDDGENAAIPEGVKERKKSEDDLYIGTYTTDDDGVISVENLSYGSYYFVETETLENYDLLLETVDFDIDETHTDNEIIVANAGREGWVVYGTSEKSLSGETRTVKTGDEADILLVLVIMMCAAGMIVVLVRRKRRVRELLVISAMLCVLCGIHINSDELNAMAKEKETVEMTGTVDTGYCDTEPEHEPYIMDTYTDKKTGKTYDVRLEFTGSECIESGYTIPTVLTGTICDYDAAYIVYKGNRYEAPGDDLSRLDGMIKAFVEDSGYPEGSYENMSYAYDGSSYTDDYGIEYRNFKVSFDAYGNRYRFSYAGSVEIESTASTETATEEAATEETATEETASEKKLTKNIEGGVDEAVPGNRIDAEAEQESPEELGDASAAESDENSEGSGENVRTDIQDNLGTRFVIITLVIVLLGAAVTGLALYRRRRTVTE